LGIGDWGLGPIPNPQSPIPNPQSPLKEKIDIFIYIYDNYIKIKKYKKNILKFTEN
jgi:hypothetical protein